MLIVGIILAIFFIGVMIIYFYGLYRKPRQYEVDYNAFMSFKEGLSLTGVPIVVFNQGSSYYNFLLDSGSENSYINPEILRENKIDYAMTDMASYYADCNGNMNIAKICKCNLEYNGKNFEFEYGTAPLQGIYEGLKEQHNITVHGVIGTDFMTKFKYVVDFERMLAYSNKKQ